MSSDAVVCHESQLYTYARLRQLPFVEDIRFAVRLRGISSVTAFTGDKTRFEFQHRKNMTNLGENMAEARQVIVESALAALRI
jgi:hypothetical protein